MFHFQCRGLVLCTFFVQRVVGKQFRVQNLFSGLSTSNFVCKICSTDCRQAISCAKFVQRVVGEQFRVQNLFSGLSASNFVCKICSAGCRQAISCAKFVQRIVGKQFCVRNLFSGLSASNFVCKICSAGCRQAISCAKFVQRVVGGQFRVQNLFSGLSASNFVCKILSLASPSPLLRPRVDAAGTEGVREYLKQRFVPGVGVCFLLTFFVVEVSAFGVALTNGVLRVDGKLFCDVAVYCQAYNVARGGYVEFFFSHCCHPFFS